MPKCPPAPAQMLSAVTGVGRDNSQSKITFETNTAVNTFAIKPITSVTANPFTGPDPNKNRIAQETIVVM